MKIDDLLNEGTFQKKKSELQRLRDKQIPLTPEERKEVFNKKAVWHKSPGGGETSAIWKSVDGSGKVWYITNTHRAWAKRPTLKDAISIFHSFVKGTA